MCEFSHPTWAPFRRVYLEYLMRALPPVARRVSSSPDAYVYLAESIQAWPDQAALANRIAAAGWRDVVWGDLTGGIVALPLASGKPGLACVAWRGRLRYDRFFLSLCDSTVPGDGCFKDRLKSGRRRGE